MQKVVQPRKCTGCRATETLLPQGVEIRSPVERWRGGGGRSALGYLGKPINEPRASDAEPANARAIVAKEACSSAYKADCTIENLR